MPSLTSSAVLSRLDGPSNMAADSRLLDLAESGRPGWRVYGWDGPWVSLGCFQSPVRDLLDPDLVPWVMRPTGGKGVLHGYDVTVGLALPLSILARKASMPPERLARTLKKVYQLSIQPIVSALNLCGMPAVLAEQAFPFLLSRRKGLGDGGSPAFGEAQDSEAVEVLGTPPPPCPPPPQTGGGGRLSDCFAVTSPNDIIHASLGLKVCGCALKLTEKAVLVQASIPAGLPLIDPKRVFERPAQIAALPWNSQDFGAAFEESITQFLERS